MKNIIKYLVALVLMAGCVIPASAQRDIRSLNPKTSGIRKEGIRDDIPRGKKRPDRQPSKAVSAGKKSGRPATRRQKDLPDTVYSHSSAKQHGWMTPLGVLTKEQVRHRSQSLMFTGRNKKGHWTKVESVDALGRPVPHSFRPYIAKTPADYDPLFNQDWSDRLDKCCMLEFIPDPTGENVIQERAYDKDHNLIYVYSRTSIGDNQYIGSYKDYYGLPAEMRVSDGYSYGTLVHITEDRWGNDSRIEYIDSKSVNKLNSDSAYAEIYRHNEAGDILSQYSVDSLGRGMIDSWDNCGVVYTYDDNHLMRSAMYTDEMMKPMRMPSDKSDTSKGTIKHLYEYDRYGRQTMETFVTDTDVPDTNKYGCHRIVSEYDSLGKMVSQTGYGLDGKLAPQDKMGVAVYVSTHDDMGNITRFECLDKDRQPVSTTGSICKIETDYDRSGNQTAVRQWKVIDGVMTLSYSERADTVDGCLRKRIQWEDGSYLIHNYDENGRKILTGTYDADDRPTLSDGDEWAYCTMEYLEIAPGKTQCITTYYDEEGNPTQISEKNREIEVCDSLAATKSLKQYKNDQLVNTYIHRYDKDFIHIQGQIDCNAFGETVRAGGASGVRFYNSRVRWTPFTEINFIECLDEFGEPDYLVTDKGSIYCYLVNNKNGNTNMTADNVAVDDNNCKAIRDQLPKVLSVEVTDSCAYRLGLRDNDVILSFGNYSVDLKNPLGDNDFKTDWTIHNVFESAEPRDMVVFRVYDGPTGKFGIDTIHGLTGYPSQLGFLAHVRYLTQRQTDRITGCWEGAVAQQEKRDRYVVIAYPEMFRDTRNRRYPLEITDPTVLAGICDVTRGHKWDCRNGDDVASLFEIAATVGRTDVVPTDKHYFFTKDGTSLINFTSPDMSKAGIGLMDGYISESMYNKLEGSYNDAAVRIDSLLAGAESMDPKTLCGYWEAEPQDSVSYSATGYLCLNEDGACAGEINGYAYIPDDRLPEDYGSPVYSTKRVLNGKWCERDSLIAIELYDEDNYTVIACAGILNATVDEATAIEYFNNDFLTYTNYYLSRMSTVIDLNNEALIRHIGKDTLVLANAAGNEITFVKKKGPEVKLLMPEYCVDSIPGCWVVTQADSLQSASMLLTMDKEKELHMSFAIAQRLADEGISFGLVFEADGRWKMLPDGLSLDIDTASVRSNLNFMVFDKEVDKERVEKGAEPLLNGLRQSFAELCEKKIAVEVNKDGELSLEGMKMRKMPENKDVELGYIEGEDGYLAKSGLSDRFVVLRWNDWNCEMNSNDFTAEFDRSKGQPRTLILMPFDSPDGEVVRYGEPMVLECPGEVLGIRVRDVEISYPYFFTKILPKYMMAR